VRIALELDDDLAPLVKRLASRRGMTMGQVASELVRKALAPKATPRMRNGVPLFAPEASSGMPCLTLVNQLRDGD
jgi:hypothetical protein